MTELKLYDSELKVMEALWEDGAMPVKRLIGLMKEKAGWTRTTTYTVVKKLVDKGAVRRSEPDFMLEAIVSRQQVREREVNELVDKLFDGSPGLLVSSMLARKDLPDSVIDELKRIVDEMK